MIRRLIWSCAVVTLLWAPGMPSWAQHPPLVIFDEPESGIAGYRDASYGVSTGEDQLRLAGPNSDKLPLRAGSAVSGTHRGILQYRHGSGTWDLFVARDSWTPFDSTPYDTLVFYLNGPETFAAGELPRIGLEDTAGKRSLLVSLGGWLTALDADTTTWQRIAIPLRSLTSVGGIARASLRSIRFAPNDTNPQERTVWIDRIMLVPLDSGAVQFPPAPRNIRLYTGPQSVIIRWEPPVDESRVAHYRIYRSNAPDVDFQPVGTAAKDARVFIDLSVQNNTSYFYRVRSVNAQTLESVSESAIHTHVEYLGDDAFLDLLQRTAFDFFWYEADSTTGLIRDRSRPDAAASIASVGFGLSSIIVGIDRGWVSRDAGTERIRRTLRTFYNGRQGPEASGTIGYKGFFYHFLNMRTATRAGSSELSTIDTALLLGGILHAREYFADDRDIRSMADSIYHRVDWRWARVRNSLVSMGWYPGAGFINADWQGYNEAMILYILALGSPRYPLDPISWSAWTQGYRWRTHYGYSFVEFPPLFGHQYSHVWIDFRGIRDSYMRTRGIDYFENSRRATLAQRAYHVDNPASHPNYGTDEWGLTASDVPGGYLARGAPPAENDEGTLAPTAPGGSYAFTPTESLRALRRMYDQYRTRLWGPYGLRDAYNVRRNWFATDYIGIDQGPILLMIENGRSGSIWRTFMLNADIQRGLQRAGFTTYTSTEDSEPSALKRSIIAWPNPFSRTASFRFSLPVPGVVTLRVYDVLGREVATLVNGRLPAGVHEALFDGATLPAGIYLYRMQHDQSTLSGRIVLIP